MNQPNILIVMTDHQRGDTVLGEHPCITPNLDRLRSQGLTFANAWCPTPHCCPARATFMTGLYPSRHGVWNNICNSQALSRGLKSGVRTFGEDLAAAGYNLAWSGKWHVSTEETPANRGWRELFVSSKGGDHHGPRWDTFRRIAQEPPVAQRGEGEILRPGYGNVKLYGAHDRQDSHDRHTVDLALSALPELAASGKPWALFTGLIGPHDPYMVPQKYLDMYKIEDIPLPPSYADEMADKPRIYKRMRDQVFGQLTPREVREAIRHFWAYCTYLDALLGELLDALDKTGQADNTVVVYTADHGDYCGDHGLFAKGIPNFRGAYHVPAVVRWPRGIACPGGRVEALVSLADFAPTFTELAGLTPDTTLTGRSLLPWFKGQAPAGWRDAIFTQCNGVELYYTQRSVRTAQWKYVFNGFDFDELYDLTHDPHEMVNLADKPQYDPIKRQLLRRMWKFAAEQDDGAVNNYVTVGLAPWGPAEAFADSLE